MKRILSVIYVMILLMTFTTMNNVIASDSSVIVLSDCAILSEVINVRVDGVTSYKGEKVHEVPLYLTSTNSSDTIIEETFNDLPLVVPLNKGEVNEESKAFNDLPLVIPLNKGETSKVSKVFNDLPLIVPLC